MHMLMMGAPTQSNGPQPEQKAAQHPPEQVPSLLMAPRYFAGEARFGEISQVAFTFQRIEAAVSYLVNNLAELSALAAQTERLDELLKALGQGHPPGRLARRRPATEIARRSTPDPGMLLSLAGLSFAAPGGGPLLASDLNLTLQTGQSLLIVGPSGCGKSSLLRCIAGAQGEEGGGGGLCRFCKGAAEGVW